MNVCMNACMNVYMYICMNVCACTYAIRGQVAGVGSLLPQCGLEDWSQVTRLGGRCLCPLNHLTGSNVNILVGLGLLQASFTARLKRLAEGRDREFSPWISLHTLDSNMQGWKRPAHRFICPEQPEISHARMLERASSSCVPNQEWPCSLSQRKHIAGMFTLLAKTSKGASLCPTEPQWWETVGCGSRSNMPQKTQLLRRWLL